MQARKKRRRIKKDDLIPTFSLEKEKGYMVAPSPFTRRGRLCRVRLLGEVRFSLFIVRLRRYLIPFII